MKPIPLKPEARPNRGLRLVVGVIVVLAAAAGYLGYSWLARSGQRYSQVWAWFQDPASLEAQRMQIGTRCGDAPFLMPTNGLVGFIWGDSFRPGHTHQGLDIFGGEGLNVTPVVAAYPGYLTREADWKSSLIIRIPSDPLNPQRQIWTYYTHLADSQGNSYIVPDFPPGTREVYVEAGTLLGYQGNYSGDPNNPTGVHLHFSIVKDNGQGGYLNELDIDNTYDPSPYLNLEANASENQDDIPFCPPEQVRP